MLWLYNYQVPIFCESKHFNHITAGSKTPTKSENSRHRMGYLSKGPRSLERKDVADQCLVAAGRSHSVSAEMSGLLASGPTTAWQTWSSEPHRQHSSATTTVLILGSKPTLSLAPELHLHATLGLNPPSGQFDLIALESIGSSSLIRIRIRPTLIRPSKHSGSRCRCRYNEHCSVRQTHCGSGAVPALNLASRGSRV